MLCLLYMTLPFVIMVSGKNLNIQIVFLLGYHMLKQLVCRDYLSCGFLVACKTLVFGNFSVSKT